MHTCHIGTAGWALSAGAPAVFGGEGTHLQRYSRVLNAAEINSTFYRLPMARTLEGWAASVPEGFRFSVKMPREITHERRLVQVERPLRAFLELLAHLKGTCGPVLVQLPPSLAFDERAELFVDQLRELYEGAIALEPRHTSWYTPEVEHMLRNARIARVAADPPRGISTVAPGGDRSLVYYRLHGSPRTYWSDYPEAELQRCTTEIDAHRKRGADVWLIFDNTAAGHALPNALRASELVAHR